MSRYGEYKRFKFELGDSSTGSLGMVIRVHARTKEEALIKANNELTWHEAVEVNPVALSTEYLNVYLSPHLTLEDLDESETEDLEIEDVIGYEEIIKEEAVNA